MNHPGKPALFVALLVTCAFAFVSGTRRASADVFFDTPSEAGADAAPSSSSSDTAASIDAGVAPPIAPPPSAIAPPPTASAPTPSASAGWITPAPTGSGSGSAGSPAPAASEYTGGALGIRGGFAFPAGAAKTSALSDVVKSVIPIALDAGYFLRPNFYIGAFFMYGFATPSRASEDTCPSGADNTCTAQQYRFGAVAEYAFRHNALMSPWVRYGIGFDVINLEASDVTGAQLSSASLFGIEWADLSAGIDVKPGYYYGIGPYFEAAIGDYFKSGLADPHVWFTIGLRARTGLFFP